MQRGNSKRWAGPKQVLPEYTQIAKTKPRTVSLKQKIPWPEVAPEHYTTTLPLGTKLHNSQSEKKNETTAGSNTKQQSRPPITHHYLIKNSLLHSSTIRNTNTSEFLVYSNSKAKIAL